MTNDLVVPFRSRGPRIAIIAHTHPSISKGGAEIAAYTLYNGLRALGCDAIFIAACQENQRDKLQRASENEYVVFTRGELFEHFYQLGSSHIGEKLAEILTNRCIQIANFHHFTNFGLGALRRVRALPDLRMVFTIHEFLAICHNHGQMITTTGQKLCDQASLDACAACFPARTRGEFHHRARLFREILSSFELFVSPSHFLARRFCEWGLEEGKIFVVENGLAHFPTAEPNPAQAGRRRGWIFGFFGQINPFKGVDIILDAADLLKREQIYNVRIRIHGNLVGQSDHFCARFRDACVSGAVEYLGAYDNRNVTKLMGECDYVVLPSRWWENSPVVIQEAFGVGCPVLCSGVGGMAEKVRDGVSGLHFRFGDAVDLARCIAEAASQEVHRRLKRGLPRPYDGTEMARRYLDVFASSGRKIEVLAPVLEEIDDVQSISFG